MQNLRNNVTIKRRKEFVSGWELDHRRTIAEQKFTFHRAESLLGDKTTHVHRWTSRRRRGKGPIISAQKKVARHGSAVFTFLGSPRKATRPFYKFTAVHRIFRRSFHARTRFWSAGVHMQARRPRVKLRRPNISWNAEDREKRKTGRSVCRWIGMGMEEPVRL